LNQPSVLMEQLLPLHSFHKTEYYNDFIKPQHIQRQMAVYIRHEGMLKAVVGMHRATAQGFDQNCLFMGDMISQWTSAALDRLQLRKQLAQEKSIRQIFEEKSDTGILLFDKTNHCVHANNAAKKMCWIMGFDHAISDDVRLPFPIPKILTDGVRNAQECQLIPHKLHISVSGQQPFKVKWEKIDTIIPDISVMVFLSEVEILPAISQLKLKQTYHLTPRELEIITHICRGKGNADIADTLYISEGTVKNHLKHIFAKMGVSNRTQVVHKAQLENQLSESD